MSEPEQRLSLLDWATVATLTAALVYVAGWSYAYHWFGAFNLGVIGLDIPAEYHFMYGFWALRGAWWLVLLYLAGLAAWAWWRRSGGSARPGEATGLLRSAVIPALPVVVLLLFVGAYQIGASAADGAYRRHHEQGFAGYPPVRVWLKPGAVTAPSRLQRLEGQLRGAEYRLLLQTKSMIYLLKPAAHAALPTVAVPLSEVAAWRVLPANPGRR
jgi:hypothetical protein